jgi:hypothetical protein
MFSEEASQAPVKNVEAAPTASADATVVDNKNGANMKNAQSMVEEPRKPKYR